MNSSEIDINDKGKSMIEEDKKRKIAYGFDYSSLLCHLLRSII